MGVNKEKKAVRQAGVLIGKAQGKSCDEIGKENGTSKSTAWRDWQELAQDETIKAEIDKLKQINLANAVNGATIEGKWLETYKDGQFSHDIAGKINSIKTSSVKIYSSLQGANTDDKGGEKAIPILGGITNV